MAEIQLVERPAGATFATVEARPLAALDRGREVLLVLPVSEERPPDPAGEQTELTGDPEQAGVEQP